MDPRVVERVDARAWRDLTFGDVEAVNASIKKGGSIELPESLVVCLVANE